ncbi:MAG: type III toxin-antitoxin system ToxN/AbiQ family toxin [Synergistaceae bacterium]|nr:type III toxin-antitoxin system ToxN/AbiQ family toxin [Synergistaceae bacterium]
MNLSFFRADAAYCDFLRQADPCVPYVSGNKGTRPFVGILLTVNGMRYYAPLTSPKSKHLSMKNQLDFMKINGGAWGAINFNNMIPIHPDCLAPVDLKISPADTKGDADYKNLLTNQLSWCNSHKNQIIKQSEKLYGLISKGSARPELSKRCCDFKTCERQYRIYCELHGLNV